MNKKIISLLIIASVFIYNSCSQKLKVPTVESKILYSISQLSDSTFLSKSVSNFEVYKDRLFFSDNFNNRICCVDSNFLLIATYGSPGRGPGELMNPDYFAIFNDSLYISDPINRKINVYSINNSKASREFYLEDKQFIESKFFISKNQHLYISTSFSNYPITVYDLKGKIIRQIGDKYDSLLTKRELARESRHLILYNDTTIISILRSKPYIEFYDLYGKKNTELNLSNIDIVDEILDYFGATGSKSFGIPSIFNYAVKDSTHLYISLFRKYRSSVTHDIILKLGIKENLLIPISKLKLLSNEDNYKGYIKFIVWKNHLLAYDPFIQSISFFENE